MRLRGSVFIYTHINLNKDEHDPTAAVHVTELAAKPDTGLRGAGAVPTGSRA